MTIIHKRPKVTMGLLEMLRYLFRYVHNFIGSRHRFTFLELTTEGLGSKKLLFILPRWKALKDTFLAARKK